MPDSYVQTADFNMAMASLRAELREDLGGIREEIGGLREILQLNSDYRVQQAREYGELKAQVDELRGRISGFWKLFTGIGSAVGALLLWKLIELIGK